MIDFRPLVEHIDNMFHALESTVNIAQSDVAITRTMYFPVSSSGFCVIQHFDRMIAEVKYHINQVEALIPSMSEHADELFRQKHPEPEVNRTFAFSSDGHCVEEVS